jgi:hypothetical protein
MKAGRGLQYYMPKVSEILQKKFGHLVLRQDKLVYYQSKLNVILGNNLKDQIKVVAIVGDELKLVSQSSSAAFWLKLNASKIEKILNVKVRN